MKISELTAGKKYYSTRATWNKDKMTGKKIRETSTVRVLKVDLINKQVLCSFNGFPAQWHAGTVCKHWAYENPFPNI